MLRIVVVCALFAAALSACSDLKCQEDERKVGTVCRALPASELPDAALGSSMCGDGLVTGAETCEPGIAAGGAGACPTVESCPHTDACSPPILAGSAADCTARCTTPVQRTECKDHDGCCPLTCAHGNDDDCPVGCGDGVVDAASGETCERGTGTECPGSCDDGDVCTQDLLTGKPSECNVACSHASITEAQHDDHCCPPGATSYDDNDCGPERAEAAMLALGPAYQFRADTVTLNGGNVATIPNRRGRDALVLAAGTLAAPASDALFGGAQSVAFTGSQWLDSDLPPSAWKFLHDGTGMESFHVFTSGSSPAASMVLGSTTIAGPAVGTSFQFNTINGASECYVQNAASRIVNSGVVSQYSANTPSYMDCSYQASAPLQWTHFVKDGVAGSGNAPTAAPDPGNPNGSFRLGAYRNGIAPASMKWCETLIFSRALHEYERQIVREYLEERYRIAAPKLTGPERDIMTMMPFSWVRADRYEASGDKVSTLLDRARPGHRYTQTSPAAQASTAARSALFGSREVLRFTDGQWYDSSLRASAWRFLHDGSGVDAWLAYAQDTPGRMLMSTYTGLNAPGVQAGTNSWVVYQSSSFAVITLADPAYPLGKALYSRYVHASAHAPAGALFRGGKLAASQPTDGTAPSSAEPGATLRIGASAGGASAFEGTWSDGIIFDRELTDYEVSRLQQYLQSRYDLTP